MNAPGTSQPKTAARGGMMGMGAAAGAQRRYPEAVGSAEHADGRRGAKWGQFNADVVWQDYNPYKKARGFRQITEEWVFVSPDVPGAEDPLSSQDAITSGLTQLLLLYPGAIEARDRAGIDFEPLAHDRHRCRARSATRI